MAFKMRSGNKVSFKNMGGSSPGKHDTGSAHVHAHGGSGSYRKDDEGNLQQTGVGGDIDEDDYIKGNNTNKESYLTKQEIKQAAKLAKQEARGENTPGGRRITRAERSVINDAKYANQLKRAEGLEAAGKGEKGFSWKEAGMSVLRGEGLLGNIASGMGKGRDKSAIIKDKQAKIAGKKDRKELRATQDVERKKLATKNKIITASDLNTDIVQKEDKEEKNKENIVKEIADAKNETKTNTLNYADPTKNPHNLTEQSYNFLNDPNFDISKP